MPRLGRFNKKFRYARGNRFTVNRSNLRVIEAESETSEAVVKSNPVDNVISIPCIPAKASEELSKKYKDDLDEISDSPLVDEADDLEVVSDASFCGESDNEEAETEESKQLLLEVPVGYRKYLVKHLPKYKRIAFFKPRVYCVSSDKIIVGCVKNVDSIEAEDTWDADAPEEIEDGGEEAVIEPVSGKVLIHDDLVNSNEILIGLEFLVEAWREYKVSLESYFCLLCDEELEKGLVLDHLISFSHRISYLDKLFPKFTSMFYKNDAIENSEVKFPIENVCKIFVTSELDLPLITTYEYLISHKQDMKKRINLVLGEKNAVVSAMTEMRLIVETKIDYDTTDSIDLTYNSTFVENDGGDNESLNSNDVLILEEVEFKTPEAENKTINVNETKKIDLKKIKSIEANEKSLVLPETLKVKEELVPSEAIFKKSQGKYKNPSQSRHYRRKQMQFEHIRTVSVKKLTDSEKDGELSKTQFNKNDKITAKSDSSKIDQKNITETSKNLDVKTKARHDHRQSKNELVRRISLFNKHCEKCHGVKKNFRNHNENKHAKNCMCKKSSVGSDSKLKQKETVSKEKSSFKFISSFEKKSNHSSKKNGSGACKHGNDLKSSKSKHEQNSSSKEKKVNNKSSKSSDKNDKGKSGNNHDKEKCENKPDKEKNENKHNKEKSENKHNKEKSENKQDKEKSIIDCSTERNRRSPNHVEKHSLSKSPRDRKYSNSPKRRVIRRQSRSPVVSRRRSRSPLIVQYRSPISVRPQSRSPLRISRRSRSPIRIRRRSPIIGRRRSLTRRKSRSPRLIRYRPSVVQRNRSRSPVIQRNRSRSPVVQRNRSRSPIVRRNRSRSPVVKRNRSKSPRGISRRLSRSPFRISRRSRSPHSLYSDLESRNLFLNRRERSVTPVRLSSRRSRSPRRPRRSRSPRRRHSRSDSDDRSGSIPTRFVDSFRKLEESFQEEEIPRLSPRNFYSFTPEVPNVSWPVSNPAENLNYPFPSGPPPFPPPGFGPPPVPAPNLQFPNVAFPPPLVNTPVHDLQPPNLLYPPPQQTPAALPSGVPSPFMHFTQSAPVQPQHSIPVNLPQHINVSTSQNNEKAFDELRNVVTKIFGGANMNQPSMEVQRSHDSAVMMHRNEQVPKRNLPFDVNLNSPNFNIPNPNLDKEQYYLKTLQELKEKFFKDVVPDHILKRTLFEKFNENFDDQVSPKIPDMSAKIDFKKSSSSRQGNIFPIVHQDNQVSNPAFSASGSGVRNSSNRPSDFSVRSRSSAEINFDFPNNSQMDQSSRNPDKKTLAQRLAAVLVKIGMVDVPGPLLAEMLHKIGAFNRSLPLQDITEHEIIQILRKFGYLSK